MTEISAEVILDSIDDTGDHRLTTMRIVHPRFILAEFNTHRVFSRNSASSRAIPTAKRIKQVREDPFIPIAWGRNQRGMSADQTLNDEEARDAELVWRIGAAYAADVAEKLDKIKTHKQIANRGLEPYLWHTALVSATEWDNFFALRISAAAQPEMRALAEAMKAARDASTPVERYRHVPFEEQGEDYSIHRAVARAARTSYARELEPSTPEADFERFEQLRVDRHWSPFEHVAKQTTSKILEANFKGWYQLRTALERDLTW